MKYNKIKTVSVVMFIALMLIAGVFAQNDSQRPNMESGPDGEKDIEAYNEGVGNNSSNPVDSNKSNPGIGKEIRDNIVLGQKFGTKMRFEQLKVQVDARIEGTNIVIDSLPENVSENKTQMAEDIRDVFEGVKEDLDNEESYNSSTFRAYKDTVNNYSKSFRELVSDSLSSEEKEELRGEIESIESEKKQQRKETIEDLRRKANSDLVSDIYSNESSKSFGEMRNRYKNGSISLEELRSSIKKELQNEDVATKVSQRKEEEMGKAQERTEKAKQKIKEKRQEIKDRIGAPEEISKKISEKVSDNMGPKNRTVGPGGRRE